MWSKSKSPRAFANTKSWVCTIVDLTDVRSAHAGQVVLVLPRWPDRHRLAPHGAHPAGAVSVQQIPSSGNRPVARPTYFTALLLSLGAFAARRRSQSSAG